jgi:PAS domain S-box-containing protein
MEEILKFAAFTVLPASALVLGTAYSLQEIYRIGQNRFYLIVLILGFMLFHQVGEFAYFFEVGEFRDPAIAEAPETAANLIAAGSVYYVLCFTRKEQELKVEIEDSRTEIQEIKDRLELIFDNVNDGILLVDLDDDEIVEANRRAHELLRYERGELEGMSPYDIHPHEPERFQELTDVVQPDGGVISENMSCRRRDGSKMPAAVSVSRTTLEDTDLMLVTIRDNTEREQYRTQVDLLGRVLRHNLRNDMSIVVGNLGTIKKRVADTGLSDIAERSIQQCRDLIETSDQTRKLNEVLDTEHRQIGAVTDLVTVVENVVEEYGSEYPAAQIETDLPEYAPVQASTNVVWAIENVVENAIVHDESEPRVHVTISNETIEQEGQKSTWTTVTVSDHGPGIPANEVTVLEDDANRTPTEHGSGLGLWIVLQIAQVFDGQLDIDRNPDSGFSTEVSLRLQPGTNGYATKSSDE